MDFTMKQVEAHIGETLTSREIKTLFGYSQSTYIVDTVLYQRKWLRLVEGKNVPAGPYLYQIVQGQPF